MHHITKYIIHITLDLNVLICVDRKVLELCEDLVRLRNRSLDREEVEQTIQNEIYKTKKEIRTQRLLISFVYGNLYIVWV